MFTPVRLAISALIVAAILALGGYAYFTRKALLIGVAVALHEIDRAMGAL